MPTVIDHVIQGTVSNGDKIDFAKEKLAVQAFIKGQEVAQADVDATGRYKLSFTSAEERPTTELRVTGFKAGEREANLASAETVMPTEFVLTGNRASVQHNLALPSRAAIPPIQVSFISKISGRVFEEVEWMLLTTVPHTFVPGGKKLLPVPGLRLDFYVVELVLKPAPQVGGMPILTTAWEARYCCSSFTAPDGTYAASVAYRIIPTKPFLRVVISQFANGSWNQVCTQDIGLSGWGQDIDHNFLVPGDKLVPKPVVTAPDTGFRFGTLGLIPFDEAHFVKGYVFSQTTDFIKGLTHRPLRGILRIFGLFAPDLQVEKYKVEIAETDENGTPVSKWEDLMDPLINHEWDPVNRLWNAEVMGPDPNTHMYRSIDSKPEFNWMEHALKLEWNSANKPDGFYVLRLSAWDQSNNLININNDPLGDPQKVPTQVMRIDNSLPNVELQAVGALECGMVPLINKTLTFNITAYEPHGHVLDWRIRALAGKDAIELNADPTALQFNPPANTGAPGEGVPAGTLETLTVVKLPPNLEACNPLVYNFELIVHGSAITGYPSSEREIRDDVSLMVTQS